MIISRWMKHWIPLSSAIFLLFLSGQASAEGLGTVTSRPMADGSTEWSLQIQTLVMMTSLMFLPAVVLMMTSFTRIIIVLGLLRTAIGTQTTPPNQVMIGIALFLTYFIMAPVINEINELAWTPLSNNEISFQQAIELASSPIREFMMAQTREKDLATFLGIAGIENVATPKDVPFSVLVPSFVTSELKTAFQIGFTLFIPFLIIDLVVASILMAMGMMMLSPMIVSLPFKLMLFVLVDGWNLVIGTIATSYGLGN